MHNGTLFLPLRLSKSSSFVMSMSSSNESIFLPLRLSKTSSFVMSKSSSKENCMISLGLPLLSHFAFHRRGPTGNRPVIYAVRPCLLYTHARPLCESLLAFYGVPFVPKFDI